MTMLASIIAQESCIRKANSLCIYEAEIVTERTLSSFDRVIVLHRSTFRSVCFWYCTGQLDSFLPSL